MEFFPVKLLGLSQEPLPPRAICAVWRSLNVRLRARLSYPSLIGKVVVKLLRYARIPYKWPSLLS